MQDTTYQDPKDPNFPRAGETRLVWRVDGFNRYSNLYTPTDEALDWDKPRMANGEPFAVGSQHGGFCYVSVQRTGRKVTTAPGGAHRGMKVQATFNIGPGNLPEDRCQVSAWLIEG